MRPPAARIIATALYVGLGMSGPWIGEAASFENAVALAGLALAAAFLAVPRSAARPLRSRVGLVLAAEAYNTHLLVLGLVAVELSGLAPTSPTYLVGFGLLAVAALGSLAVWPRATRRLGPKHVLDVLLLFQALLLAVFAIYRGLDLPPELFLVVAPFVGATHGGLRTAAAELATGPHLEPRAFSAWSQGAVAGPLLWLFFAAFGAPVFALLVLGASALAAFLLLRRVPDPTRPGPGPLAAAAPWGTVPGRAVPRGPRRLLAAPFLALYVVLSWILFLPFARPQEGFLVIEEGPWQAFLYQIPNLTRDPLLALRSLLTAPFLNLDSVQLVYVTALLALFGFAFEAREGVWRTVLVFFAATFAGAIVAGLLLHAIYPAVWDNAFFERAWTRSWSGGSAGAFGLMGALAARARLPWPLLGFFVFWELNVGWFFLRSYTPAFHLTALATGFLLTRYALRPIGSVDAAPTARVAARSGP